MKLVTKTKGIWIYLQYFISQVWTIIVNSDIWKS